MLRWTIDLGLREIRDGAGKHLVLRRRAFELLLYLASQHDRVVPKDELIEANWRGVVVTDDSLTKVISEIRGALGDELRHTVRTISGRGYLLTGWQREGPLWRSPAPVAGVSGEPAGGNLPWGTRLIGRDDEIFRLCQLLRSNPLVTIVGPGGVGKTALSLAVARAVGQDYHDGPYFADLSAAANANAAIGAVQHALGLMGSPPEIAVWAMAMKSRRLLLVVDNCEHLTADMARIVATLMATAPGIRFLATSREPLGVEGEQLFRLQTLAYPQDVPISAVEALSFPAIALLASRAQMLDADYILNEIDVPSAVEICRRLDGIPLAIVLAGARLSAMSMPEVAAMLGQSFELLSGPRGSSDRQRTMRAMVGWSVNLLDEAEQDLFMQIAVFAGPASVADIQQVCELGGEPADMSRIQSLVDKSLLNVHRQADVTRYSYFETTRHYGLERLAARDGGTTRARHASYLAALFAQAEVEIEVRPAAQWRSTYAPYLDNVRAALTWCFLPGGDRVLGARLAAYSADLFETLSLQSERQGWLEKAAGGASGVTEPTLRARLLLWQALGSSWGTGRREMLHEAARLFEQSGETFWQGRALSMAMVGDARSGDWARVWQEDSDARVLLLPHGPTRALGDYFRYRSKALISAGRMEEAASAIGEAGSIAESIGDTIGALWAQSGLAEIEFKQGNIRAAIAMEELSLQQAVACESPSDVMYSCIFLAYCRLLLGHGDIALPEIGRAFELSRQLGNRDVSGMLVGLTAFWLASHKDVAGLPLAVFALRRLADQAEEMLPIEDALGERLKVILAATAPDALADFERQVGLWPADHATERAHAALLAHGFQESFRSLSGPSE